MATWRLWSTGSVHEFIESSNETLTTENNKQAPAADLLMIKGTY